MFRNHTGIKNKTLFNPCADCILLYVSFSTHIAYLFASEQWLFGSELSVQIFSRAGPDFDPQPYTSGAQHSRCRVISIILFLLCPWSEKAFVFLIQKIGQTGLEKNINVNKTKPC